MEYRRNYTRFEVYDSWAEKKQAPYNYSANGLLIHIMTRGIVNSKNRMTKAMMGYFEESLIHVLKYTDHLRHFKDYHWKNR